MPSAGRACFAGYLVMHSVCTAHAQRMHSACTACTLSVPCQARGGSGARPAARPRCSPDTRGGGADVRAWRGARARAGAARRPRGAALCHSKYSHSKYSHSKYSSATSWCRTMSKPRWHRLRPACWLSGACSLRQSMPQAAHKLRPASANQPAGPRWPAMQALLSTWGLAADAHLGAVDLVSVIIEDEPADDDAWWRLRARLTARVRARVRVRVRVSSQGQAWGEG